MEPNTLVTSGMANNTDKAPLPIVLKLGGQGTNTLVNGRTDGNTDKAAISMPMEE